MTISEYREATKRTLPDLGSLEKNIQHMEMGIITEIGEIVDPFKKKLAYGKPIDLVNVGEEIADLSWYVSNKANLHDNLVLQDFTEDEAFEATTESKEYFMELSEEDKNECIVAWMVNIQAGVIYNQGPMRNVNNVFKTLSMSCSMLGLSYFEQLDKNIRKLKARFPDKFDADRAINRDLEAERKELEQ